MSKLMKFNPTINPLPFDHPTIVCKKHGLQYAINNPDPECIECYDQWSEQFDKDHPRPYGYAENSKE